MELVASQGTSAGGREPAVAAKGGGQLQRPWAAAVETAALINWKVHSSTQHPINHQINLTADSRGVSEFYQCDYIFVLDCFSWYILIVI